MTISVGTEVVVDHWYLDRSCVWICNLNCGGTPQGGSRSIGNFNKNPSVGIVGSTLTKSCYWFSYCCKSLQTVFHSVSEAVAVDCVESLVHSVLPVPSTVSHDVIILYFILLLKCGTQNTHNTHSIRNI